MRTTGKKFTCFNILERESGKFFFFLQEATPRSSRGPLDALSPSFCTETELHSCYKLNTWEETALELSHMALILCSFTNEEV